MRLHGVVWDIAIGLLNLRVETNVGIYNVSRKNDSEWKNWSCGLVNISNDGRYSRIINFFNKVGVELFNDLTFAKKKNNYLENNVNSTECLVIFY